MPPACRLRPRSPADVRLPAGPARPAPPRSGTTSQLGGCINDAKCMEYLLRSKYAYPPDCILLMADDHPDPLRRPTRANMYRGKRRGRAQRVPRQRAGALQATPAPAHGSQRAANTCPPTHTPPRPTPPNPLAQALRGSCPTCARATAWCSTSQGTAASSVIPAARRPMASTRQSARPTSAPLARLSTTSSTGSWSIRCRRSGRVGWWWVGWVVWLGGWVGVRAGQGRGGALAGAGTPAEPT